MLDYSHGVRNWISEIGYVAWLFWLHKPWQEEDASMMACTALLVHAQTREEPIENWQAAL
jgi:hypothetical protein